jgi:hypothetical protein
MGRRGTQSRGQQRHGAPGCARGNAGVRLCGDPCRRRVHHRGVPTPMGVDRVRDGAGAWRTGRAGVEVAVGLASAPDRAARPSRLRRSRSTPRRTAASVNARTSVPHVSWPAPTTVIHSHDAEADRAFFRDVLGYPHVDAGAGWLIFKLPPVEIAVHPVDGPPARELYLMCDDLDATMSKLARRERPSQPSPKPVGGG